MNKVTIIGAGPAGLFGAYLLLENGYAVDLYDQSSGVAKKFLVAGNGGLNLTHSEELSLFSKRYFKDEKRFAAFLKSFSPRDLRQWCERIGVETFVGSSGRVFPTSFKAADILKKWLDHLKSHGHFQLFLKHRLVDINKDKTLTFETPRGKKTVKEENLIFALGGASWKKTGSDGAWKELFENIGIKTLEFQPMNCGFERKWSDYFIKNVDRVGLKHVEITFQKIQAKGDLMLTPYGIEGGVIYALSHLIRDEINKGRHAVISLDLRPGLSYEALLKKIENKPKKITMSNHLRKALNFDKYTFTLLKELLSPADFESMNVLAQKIKSLEISLEKTRPLDEAISTSGGVCFSELTNCLELKKLERAYVVGEMLDFEAPTGGYLLQGAFSTAWVAVNDLMKKDGL